MLSPPAGQKAKIPDEIAEDLRNHLAILSGTLPEQRVSPVVDIPKQTSDAALHLRQSLESGSERDRARDAFRSSHGFETLLDKIKCVFKVYLRETSSPERQSKAVDILYLYVGILRAALQNHDGNRKYFNTRIPGGGWKVLEITYSQCFNNAIHLSTDSFDKLLGILVVFALNDDSAYCLFAEARRRMSSDVTDHRLKSEKAPELAESSRSSVETQSSLVETLVKALCEDTRVCNAEALLIIFQLWLGLRQSISFINDNHQSVYGLIPPFLMKISKSSFHNLLALHRTDLFSVLTEYSVSDKIVWEFPELCQLAQNILNLGVTEQGQAGQLYHAARSSMTVAELIVRSLEAPGNPPFIHFDLSVRGFASVELPAIGKQFPPTGNSGGYTLAIWLNIVKFDPNSHTTIFGAFDASHTCFLLLYIEKGTRKIILQTSSSTSSRPSVRFKSVSFDPNRWYHVALVHQRPKTISSSRASLYINGEFVEQVKAHYPLSVSAGNTFSGSAEGAKGKGGEAVQAFLGTPRDLATTLQPDGTCLQWRVASTHLMSDTLSDDLIAVLYRLGHQYWGNYQDCLGSFQTYEASAALNLRNENLHYGREEKSDIVVAVRQRASLILPETFILLNFSPINLLTAVDDPRGRTQSSVVENLSKSSARVFRAVLREGRQSILINGALPSIDSALCHRSGVAVLNGDPDVVIPQMLDNSFWRLGGCSSVVLSLLASSRSPEETGLFLRGICASIKNNWRNSEAMERDNGFGVLANVLSEKLLEAEPVFHQKSSDPEKDSGGHSSFNAFCLDILYLLLDFMGYQRAYPELSVINNPLAYRVLIVDLNVWRSLGEPVQEVYYQQFIDFGVKSKFHRFNTKRLIRMRIAKRWLEALKTDTFDRRTLPHFLNAFDYIVSASLTPDILRAAALTITYGLHCDHHGLTRTPSSKSTLRVRPNRRRGQSTSASTKDVFARDTLEKYSLTRRQVVIDVLEVLAKILCHSKDTGSITRFAKAVTSKWLLHLIDDEDAHVISLATRILSRILVINEKSYMERFINKTRGLDIMRNTLGRAWRNASLWWSCFSVLFGKDVAKVDFTRKLDLYSMIDNFVSDDTAPIFCSDMLIVITSMLKHALHDLTISNDTNNDVFIEETDDDAMNTRQPVPYEGSRINNEPEQGTMMYHSILRFLADIYGKSRPFQDLAASSTYVQELLHVIYPVIVGSDDLSAEAELHLRDEHQNLSAEAVRSRPHSPPIHTKSIHTSSVERPSEERPRRTSTPRRMSSYVLLSSEWKSNKRAVVGNGETKARLHEHANSFLVEEILEIITAIFCDQILYRKEFMGLGLFMKAPPGTRSDQAQFETFILRNTIQTLDHIIKLNLQLLWEPRVLTNLSRFAGHLKEATHEGWFTDGATVTLDFVAGMLEYLQLSQIRSIKSVRLCNQTIVTIADTLKRTVVLKMSELHRSGPGSQVVNFLEQLTKWQAVLWPEESGDTHTLRRYSFLLYQQLQSNDSDVRRTAADAWRMLVVQRPTVVTEIFEDIAAPSKSDSLLAGLRKVVECDNEVFFDWSTEHGDEIKQLFAPLSISWEEFATQEHRTAVDNLNNRVTKRREKLKQWQAEKLATEDVLLRHDYSARHWQSNIYASELVKSHRSIQDQLDNQAFNSSTWEKMERALHRPGGLLSHKDTPIWRLDETEGRNRIRLRLIPLESDEDLRLEQRPKNGSNSVRKASNASKKDWNAKQIQKNSKSPNAIHDSNGIDPSIKQREGSQASSEDSLPQVDAFEMINALGGEDEEHDDKNRRVMRSLQRGDQVAHINNISRVIGLEACEGLLIQGKSHLYMIDHLFQRSDGEILNVWQAPAEERDSYVQSIAGRNEAGQSASSTRPSGFETRHWNWEEIMSIYKRRFLFRDVALEVFFVDGRSYLLICRSGELRDVLYQQLKAQSSKAKEAAKSDSKEALWRADSLPSSEEQSHSLGSKFSGVFTQQPSHPVIKKWLKGEISNFHYLMLVNTMAGRTFNDLTQYPVFPWVIADYTSSELDLSNPRSFRDLSKPMGCQHPGRQEDFRERYRSFAEMGDDASTAFHYGTHYSSAMIVTSYLIRLRPYTQSYLLLQGGTFDHPDRLFYDVGKAWLSASRDNMTDVRELIPEFYAFPEFLVNSNHFDFGNRQSDGGAVDSVILPPWAKGDPKVFIAKQREALESDYVSQHLHQWIDLIFGHKQRGEAAVEAINVFHHLSYHGAKDLDTITDTDERLATIGIIHNFGQTPHQVFQRAHPLKDKTKIKSEDLESNVENLTRLPFTVLNTEEPIHHLAYAPKQNRLFCSGAFRVHLPPLYDKVVEWGFIDGSIRFHMSDSKRIIGLSEHVHQTQVSCVLVLDSKTLVTAGMDSTIAVWTMEHSSKTIILTPKTYFFGHGAAVNVLTASPAFATLLSASTDGQILFWDLNRLQAIRKLSRGMPVQCACINDVTGDILICHRTTMVLLTLNGELIAERSVFPGNQEDNLYSCAFYEGPGNKYLARQLIFTGHKHGVVHIWHKTITDGKFALEHIKTLHHLDQSGSNIPSTILSILPRERMVYTGDEDGHVYEWDCIRRQ